MPALNKLSVQSVQNAKPETQLVNGKSVLRPAKYSDGGGLSLKVEADGKKWWLFRYRFGGLENSLSFGIFPDVSLAEARKQRAAARALLKKSPPVDPSDQRKAEKRAQSDSFSAVSDEWFQAKQSTNAKKTRDRNTYLLNLLRARFGKRPLKDVDTAQIIRAIKAIQQKHGPEQARRALGVADMVFGWAVVNGYTSSNAAADLKAKHAIENRESGHWPSIVDDKNEAEQRAAIGKLMQDIDSSKGQPSTRAYLKLLALNFCRPTELRKATWDQVNLDEGTMQLPPHQRKKVNGKEPQPLLIPLAPQSVEILRELKKTYPGFTYVFPSMGRDKPLSENAAGVALKKLGYDGIHCPHGFRAMARTVLDEQLNFPVDWIEHQSGHSVKDPNGRSYNRTKFLTARRKMLAAWADFLDAARDGKPYKAQNVVALKGAA